MKSPRLFLPLVLTFALGAGAQINAGKPVLSAPPSPRGQTPAATSAPATAVPAAAPSPDSAPAPGQAPPPAAAQASGTSSDSAGGAVPLPAAGSADVPPTYVIGPDDIIAVNVWREPSLSGSLPVRPDGMISLALVGDLQASGFTPMQLAQDITTRLRKFVNDPNVTVTVTGVNSKRIYLIGEIGKVGPQPLTAGLTPLDAIATAGGPSPYANSKHIYILRTVNGKQVKLPFDYKKAVKTGDQQGVTLLPGDKIVVP